MIRRSQYQVIFSLALATILTAAAAASNRPADRRVIDPTVSNQIQYSFPTAHQRPMVLGTVSKSGVAVEGRSMSASASSPGLLIGHTWYDHQRYGSMRRMVGWGFHNDVAWGGPGDDIFAVHFTWTRLMPPSSANLHYAYQAWVENFSTGGSLLFAGDGSSVQAPGDWAGYSVMDVDQSNRAVMSGNYDQGLAGHSTIGTWFDRVPLAAFYFSDLVPDTVQEGGCPGQEVLWPAMAYQEGDGVTPGFQDTVLHLFGLVQEQGSACTTAKQSLYYFRKVGALNEPGQIGGIPGVWDFPAYAVDTTFTWSQDIFASHQSGKLAICWAAPRPDPGDCDTCSSNTGAFSVGSPQVDNDLFMQISDDQGVSWQNRVNLTIRPHPDSVSSPTYWPYTDLSLLIDEDDDEAHIAWTGRYYEPGSGEISLGCRLFHWSEGLGFTFDNNYGPGGTPDGMSRAMMRVTHDAVWDQPVCDGGAWQMNISKMSISQCIGKHYITFVMFNDVPNGIDDDCASRAYSGDRSGAANGELWVVVSNDGGVTWDRARNLTNSYSGGCDPPGGVGGPCDSDHWPSSAPYGTFYTTSGGTIVEPAGGTDPGWYVDVMYVNDPDPGGIVMNEGTWQQADILWFRMACVEPVPIPNPAYDPHQIDFPSCSRHGEQVDRELTLQNYGTVTWDYVLTSYELTGPGGWLIYSGFGGSIVSGLNNSETGIITLNSGGAVNSPGTIVSLQGGLVFTTVGATSAVDTVPIMHTVADTCVPPSVDTISSTVFSLVVSSDGNFGNMGDGGVNMDFVYPDTTGPDCDSSANVTLYDGSPFVMWVDGADTVANWSIFSDGWLSDRGFRPRVGRHKFESYLFERYSSGVYSTNDSSICLESIWYSPRNYGDNDNGFFVQCVRLWSAYGMGKNNLTVGEVVDWDIESDSGVENYSDFYIDPGQTPFYGLIYQQGVNYPDGDTSECQDNSERYGGVLPRGTLLNGSLLVDGAVYNAFTIDNATYAFPEGRLKPQQLYEKINMTSGYESYSSADPDSEFVDLAMVVTNVHQFNLGASDTLEMYYVLASSISTPGGPDGEFRDWIDAGAAFDDARGCYADWQFPSHIAYEATSITIVGDVTGGFSESGASATYSALTNSTTLTGSAPIVYEAADGDELCVTGVDDGGPVAYHRVSWLSAETDLNPSGADTTVFLHEGEGVGAAKAATFSWYLSNDGSPANSLTGSGFSNPANNSNLDAFIATTNKLIDYVGWSPEVPVGNDAGVPRTVNETIVEMSDVYGEWLYVKTTTDGGGGPYAGGTQIDGFRMFTGVDPNLCGDYNGSGPVPDIADISYLVNYLYKGGPAPPSDGRGDIDDFEVITNRDLLYLVNFLFLMGPFPTCPATRPRLYDLAIADDSVYVHTYESLFPYAAILGPDDSTYTIHVHISSDTVLEAANVPFTVRLGDEIPEIVSVSAQNCVNQGTYCMNLATISADSGTVTAAIWGGALAAGSYQIAEVEIKVPPDTNRWRPISIELDSLPPVQSGRFSHQVWATTPGFNPKIYRPEVYYFPCLGQMRGNINYDLQDVIDISDLTYMVGYMFKTGFPPTCFEEVDVTADLSLDVSDLTYMVGYMFKNGPAPEPCPVVAP